LNNYAKITAPKIWEHYYGYQFPTIWKEDESLQEQNFQRMEERGKLQKNYRRERIRIPNLLELQSKSRTHTSQISNNTQQVFPREHTELPSKDPSFAKHRPAAPLFT
jgi:hypothetical protein